MSVFDSLKSLERETFLLESRGLSVILFRRESSKVDRGAAYNIVTVASHSNPLSPGERIELSAFIEKAIQEKVDAIQ